MGDELGFLKKPNKLARFFGYIPKNVVVDKFDGHVHVTSSKKSTRIRYAKGDAIIDYAGEDGIIERTDETAIIKKVERDAIVYGAGEDVYVHWCGRDVHISNVGKNVRVYYAGRDVFIENAKDVYFGKIIGNVSLDRIGRLSVGGETDIGGVLRIRGIIDEFWSPASNYSFKEIELGRNAHVPENFPIKTLV